MYKTVDNYLIDKKLILTPTFFFDFLVFYNIWTEKMWILIQGKRYLTKNRTIKNQGKITIFETFSYSCGHPILTFFKDIFCQFEGQPRNMVLHVDLEQCSWYFKIITPWNLQQQKLHVPHTMMITLWATRPSSIHHGAKPQLTLSWDCKPNPA